MHAVCGFVVSRIMTLLRILVLAVFRWVFLFLFSYYFATTG